MADQPSWIWADWPVPTRILAGVTTRHGGVSEGHYASFNLAEHVGDEPLAVAENRSRLRQWLQLPAEPCWLNQVHGIQVCTDMAPGIIADASVTRIAGQACVVLTADCLPVLLCDDSGQVVAAAHAGWRGLAAGVVVETVRRMKVDPGKILAWLGPAIGSNVFEVGDEVRAAFLALGHDYTRAFRAHTPGKWWMDIYEAARLQLAGLGLTRIYGGGECTVTNTDRYFSYRRDGQTGRMASLIWISATDRV